MGLWKRGLLGARRLARPDSLLAKSAHSHQMPLEDIYAVQLIGEFVSPNMLESYIVLSDSDESLYERHR